MNSLPPWSLHPSGGSRINKKDKHNKLDMLDCDRSSTVSQIPPQVKIFMVSADSYFEQESVFPNTVVKIHIYKVKKQLLA